MVFKNFTGNEAMKKQISSLIDNGRLPHAIVLEGAPESGKLTLAREIAAALVCTGGGNKPCGSCPACKKMVAKSHPDVSETIASLKRDSFKVDTVRALRNDAYVLPNEAEYKVYILGNACSMNNEAQNALLKVLEEPPKHVIWILTVTSKALLRETVLSRSVVFTVEESQKQYEEASLKVATDFIEALLGTSEYKLLLATAPLEGSNEGIKTICALLGEVFRCALVLCAGGKLQPAPVEASVVNRLSSSLSKGQLIALLDFMGQMQAYINKNANNTLLLTKLCYGAKQAVL